MPHSPFNPPPRRPSPMESAKRLLEGLRVRGVDGTFYPAYVTFERDLPSAPYVRTPEHAEAERQFGLGKVEYRLVWALET